MREGEREKLMENVLSMHRVVVVIKDFHTGDPPFSFLSGCFEFMEIVMELSMEMPINLEYRLTTSAINAGYCEYRLAE